MKRRRRVQINVRLRQLPSPDSSIKIFVVDGERIRDREIEFTMGGNAGRYPRMVPRDEVWIDRNLSPLDRAATIVHELRERQLMLGRGMSYARAHGFANRVERALRKKLRARVSRG